MGIVYFLMSISAKSLSAFGNVELRTGRSHLVTEGFLWGISLLPPSVTGSLTTYLSFRCSAGFPSGKLQITDCYGYGKQTLKRALNSTEWWNASVTLCFRNWTRNTELIVKCHEIPVSRELGQALWDTNSAIRMVLSGLKPASSAPEEW